MFNRIRPTHFSRTAIGAIVGLVLTAGPLQVNAATPSLSILDSYDLALLHDATLSAARARSLAEQEIVDQAEAQLRPNISLSGNYTVADYEKSSATASPIKSNTLKLNLVQPIYNKRLSHIVDRANLAVVVSELKLEGERQAMAMAVVEHYLSVLLGKRNVELFEAETESYRHQWEKVSAALELGLASRADVLDAKARNDEGMSRVLIAKRELEQARFSLQRRTGHLSDPVDLKMLPQEKYQPLSFDTASWLQKINQGNISIKLASGDLSVAQEEVRVARSDHYPIVKFQASLGYTDSDDSSTIQDRDARLSLTLDLPLYQGGGTNSRIRQAQAIKNQAHEALRGARETALLESRNLLFTLETGYANIEVLRLALNAREKSLEAAEASRKLGLKDLSDVLDVQARLYQTHRELNAAIHDNINTHAQLLAVAGLLVAEKLEEFDEMLLDQ